MKNINDYINKIDKEHIIDIRTDEEIKQMNIKNTTHINQSTLEEDYKNLLNKENTYYIMCRSGKRAQDTTDLLNSKGYNCVNIGGILQYEGEIQYQTHTLDCSGTACPLPFINTTKKIEQINDYEVLDVTSSDAGFLTDMVSWTSKKGYKILESSSKSNNVNLKILKTPQETKKEKENATIVLFSGDYDKAIASLIIAQGAAAMGKNVTIYATFWGLNFLKDPNKSVSKSNIVEKGFDFMLPKNMSKLPLSQMNYFGMGRKMIEKLMQENNVDSLEVMYHKAIDLGVKFLGCSMSMDLMGIKEEELYENVIIGGVATYLTDCEDAGLTLFI